MKIFLLIFISNILIYNLSFAQEHPNSWKLEIECKHSGDKWLEASYVVDLVDNKFATKKLPVEKRYSARFFSLDKIFRSAILEDAVVSELPWYHNIDSWENYCNFIGSKNRDRIFRPTEFLLKYREFNPIGEDNEAN